MQWRKKYTRPLRCGQPRPQAFFPLGIAVCAILATVLVPNFAEGQMDTWTYSAAAEETFDNALAAYQQGRFDEAINLLRQLAEFPLNQRSSAGQFVVGRALYRLERFAEAIEAALALQRRFPTSRYLPDTPAVDRRLVFSTASTTTRPRPSNGRLLATQAPLGIQAQAAERLAAMDWNGQVKEQELTQLRQAVGAGRLREALFFGRARWFQRLGWEEEAAEAMQTYRDSVVNGIFAPLAAVWGSSQTTYRPRVGSGPPQLGLLLPVTGPYRRIGEELHPGCAIGQSGSWQSL